MLNEWGNKWKVCNLWYLLRFLLGEAAGLRGVGGGGRFGLGGREPVEPPGDRGGEAVPLTAWPFGTITQSSESLEGDVSLLDLEIKKQYYHLRHYTGRVCFFNQKYEIHDS